MKKITVTILAVMMLISVIVLPVSAEEADEHLVLSELAYILYEKDVCICDPVGFLTAFFEIDKEHLNLQDLGDPYEGTSSEGEDLWMNYYYDFDGNSPDIADADISMKVLMPVDLDRNAEHRCYDSGCFLDARYTLSMNKTALSYVSEDFAAFIAKMATPRKLFDLADVEVPEEYYSEETYSDSKLYLESDAFDFYFLSGDHGGDTCYFTSPSSVELKRRISLSDYMPENWYSEYGIPAYYGVSQCEMTVNYAEPTGVENVDQLDYEVESVDLFLVYYIYCDEQWQEFAPQTGIATALLAVAALVSGAYVVKKRRR